MAPRKTSFPAVRACIFDMDGLLINTEDIITETINRILEAHGRPVLTRSMRAQLMGVPGSSNADPFHNWAKLPISREQFDREFKEQTRLHFPDCRPLPGAEKIVSNLTKARCADSGAKIELALASGTKSSSYQLKSSQPATKQLLDYFRPERRVLGDDSRLKPGRGKPAPDTYLLALELLNSALSSGESLIRPEECLIIEDSVAGVEAGRRAGMRVVWVPHPDLALEYQAMQKDVLAGRTKMFDIGNESQLGEIDDGWAEKIESLEHFDYDQYGIELLV